MENEKVVSCDNCGRQVALPVYLVNVDGRNLCDECIKESKGSSEEQVWKEDVRIHYEPSIGILEEKYGVLRFLNGFYKFLAVLVAIVAFFTAVFGKGIESFFALVGGIAGVISLLAFAEMQKVFIDTEENTREIVRQLKILNKK